MRLGKVSIQLLRVGLIAVFALIIASCAAVQAPYNVLTGQRNLVPPKDPIFGPGMKLFSPDEAGWYYAPHAPLEYSIVKPGRVKGETFAFLTYAIKLAPNQDRKSVIANFKAEVDGPSNRFKNIKVDVREYPQGPGGNCLLRHWTAEDGAPAGLEGKGSMIMEGVDFMCIHPKERTTAAFISYSQRYFPGGRDPLLTEKATACIRNLQFNDEYR